MLYFPLKPKQSLAVLLLAIGVILSASAIKAAWEAPTALPPDGNVDPPLNEGVDPQIKSGPLGAYIMSVGNISTDPESYYFRVDDEESDATPFLIDKDGKVGIGTSSPSRSLHIVGNEARLPAIIVEQEGNTANSAGDLFLYRARGSSSNKQNVQVGDSLGYINFNGYYNGWQNSSDSITSIVESTSGGVIRSAIKFQTADLAGVPQERMTIDKDGKVGIGSSSPMRKLVITEDDRLPTDPNYNEEQIYISANGEDGIDISSFSDSNILNPVIATRRGRGSNDTPLPPKDKDTLFEIWATSYDGQSPLSWSAWPAGSLEFRSDGDPVEGVSGKATSYFVVRTTGPAGYANQTPSDHFVVDKDGDVAIFQDPGQNRIPTPAGSPPDYVAYPLDLQINHSDPLRTAMIRINQNNAQKLWTGLRLDRQDVIPPLEPEKWFIGMDDAEDDLIIRRNGSQNALTIDDGVNGTIRAAGDICTDAGGGRCLSSAGGGGFSNSIAGPEMITGTGTITIANSDPDIMTGAGGANFSYLSPGDSVCYTNNLNRNTCARVGRIINPTRIDLLDVKSPATNKTYSYLKPILRFTDSDGNDEVVVDGRGTIMVGKFGLDARVDTGGSHATSGQGLAISGTNRDISVLSYGDDTDKGDLDFLRAGGYDPDNYLPLLYGYSLGNVNFGAWKPGTPANNWTGEFMRTAGMTAIASSDHSATELSTNLLFYYTSGTSNIYALKLNSSGEIVFNSGSDRTEIGVGENNPESMLHLTNNSDGPIVRLEGNVNNYRGTSIRNFSSNSEDWFIGANNVNNFVVRRNESAGGDALTINKSTGHIGIGTSTPNELLTLVQSNENLDSGFYSYNDYYASDFDINFFRARGTQAAPLDVNYNPGQLINLGGLQWHARSGSRFLLGAMIQAMITATPGQSTFDLPTSLSFATSPDGSANPVPRMIIHHSGNIGIGVDNPIYKVDIEGDLRVSGDIRGSSGIYHTSDKRLKNILGEYNMGLEEIKKINTFRFKFKENELYNFETKKEYIGPIAQDVQKYIPGAVETDKNGYLTMNDAPVIWAMLNAIKELDEKNQKLNEKNANLEKQVKALNNRMDAIEKMLSK